MSIGSLWATSGKTSGSASRLCLRFWWGFEVDHLTPVLHIDKTIFIFVYTFLVFCVDVYTQWVYSYIKINLWRVYESTNHEQRKCYRGAHHDWNAGRFLRAARKVNRAVRVVPQHDPYQLGACTARGFRCMGIKYAQCGEARSGMALMKAIIKGFRIDTDKADFVGSVNHGYYGSGDFSAWEADLYCTKRKKVFFLAGRGGPMTRWARSCGDNTTTGGSGIIVLSTDEAREIAKNCLDMETIKKYFEA